MPQRTQTSRMLRPVPNVQELAHEIYRFHNQVEIDKFTGPIVVFDNTDSTHNVTEKAGMELGRALLPYVDTHTLAPIIPAKSSIAAGDATSLHEDRRYILRSTVLGKVTSRSGSTYTMTLYPNGLADALRTGEFNPYRTEPVTATKLNSGSLAVGDYAPVYRFVVVKETITRTKQKDHQVSKAMRLFIEKAVHYLL